MRRLLSPPPTNSHISFHFCMLLFLQSQSEEVVLAFEEYCQYETELEGAEELFQEAGDDAEMREMARSEMKTIEAALEELQTKIKILLLPRDPNDDRNCMLEIRAGTGGSEANIFAGELSPFSLLCISQSIFICH